LQVTHHIAADIDSERQFISDELIKAGAVDSIFEISGVGPSVNGRNGGGDRYFTDGEVVVHKLVSDCKMQRDRAPAILPSAPVIEVKNGIWQWLRPLM
jgi:hypothetical protein